MNTREPTEEEFEAWAAYVNKLEAEREAWFESAEYRNSWKEVDEWPL